MTALACEEGELYPANAALVVTERRAETAVAGPRDERSPAAVGAKAMEGRACREMPLRYGDFETYYTHSAKMQIVQGAGCVGSEMISPKPSRLGRRFLPPGRQAHDQADPDIGKLRSLLRRVRFSGKIRPFSAGPVLMSGA